jgi:hypothetical protein
MLLERGARSRGRPIIIYISQLDGYLTNDEFRDTSEMFDLDGAS